MKSNRSRLLLALLALSVGVASLSVFPLQAASPCQFQKADAGVNFAFCDTFDQPHTLGPDRSGSLDGVIWGVSRISSDTDPSRGRLNQFAATVIQKCGSAPTVYPDNDVAVCNGQLVEAVNDNGGQTILALYPKQPFDIAGRTGTVVFDVSADSQGPHAAWPGFVYTDQPVPAPYSSAAGLATSARNSIGFTLAAACGQWGCGFTGTNNYPNLGQPSFDGTCTSVDEIFVTRNYALTQYGAGGFNQDACVLKPTVAGQVNHFEVRLSATGIQIYGSDAGKTALKLLAHMTISVPLTRGLIWVEDVHYNANKFNTQGAHTFLWDNIGFDGPFLPRDLTFDVPEVKAVGSDGTMRLGWRAPYGGSTQALTASVASLSQATGAAVLFTWNAMDALVPSVRVNGGAWHDTPWPGGGQWSWKTIAVPVALSELRTGSNLLEFKTADSTNGAGVGLANVDILLIAAGGVPCFANPNQSCTGTPVPTAVPTATPTPTPTTFPLSAGQSLLISCPTTLTLVGNRLDCAQ